MCIRDRPLAVAVPQLSIAVVASIGLHGRIVPAVGNRDRSKQALIAGLSREQIEGKELASLQAEYFVIGLHDCCAGAMAVRVSAQLRIDRFCCIKNPSAGGRVSGHIIEGK